MAEVLHPPWEAEADKRWAESLEAGKIAKNEEEEAAEAAEEEDDEEEDRSLPREPCSSSWNLSS